MCKCSCVWDSVLPAVIPFDHVFCDKRKYEFVNVLSLSKAAIADIWVWRTVWTKTNRSRTVGVVAPLHFCLRIRRPALKRHIPVSNTDTLSFPSQYNNTLINYMYTSDIQILIRIRTESYLFFVSLTEMFDKSSLWATVWSDGMNIPCWSCFLR